MHQGKFATAINCMDGRTQEPVANFLKSNLHVDYVDTITEPGPDKILAQGPDKLINSIKQRVLISVEKHSSRNIAIVAHYDCAGNPVDKQTHLQDLQQAINAVKSWNLPATIIGLWINDEWQVEIIYDSRSKIKK